jgi:hypothetical protein
VPGLAIVVVLGLVAIAGIGQSGADAVDRGEVRKTVARLLSGVPQHGATLGSANAPITLWVYADLECPTVNTFAKTYLPAIIERWVRDGTLKLEYHSLETDTADEHTFFRQEAGALAAGRQDKMWDYALTFILEQGEEFSGYATEGFRMEIAAQVPGLARERWKRDRRDPLLSERVALDLHSAAAKELRFTPSFLLGFSEKGSDHTPSVLAGSAKHEIESSLRATVAALLAEASGDVPTFGVLGA